MCNEYDGLLCNTVIFGGKEKSFWEKNDYNMSETIPWREFRNKQDQVGRNLFSNYHFQKEDGVRTNFIKLPGFVDGSCLWSHLGVTPKYMMKILKNCVEKLQEKLLENLTDKDQDFDLLSEISEIVQALDPLGLSNKNNNPDALKDFENLLQNSEKVIKQWYKLVKKHGGTVFNVNEEPENVSLSQNQKLANNLPSNSRDAIRPPNGETFFEVMSKYLQTNIAIFSKKSSESPQINRFFKCIGAKHWLYLIQSRDGNHYDILVEKGEPVSRAIIAEMDSFLKSKKN
ncbi:hypothetical protein [Holospora elegans]|nr:hypothetical protein [Holospora elegans]